MAATRLDPDPPAPSRAGRARRGPSRWQLVALIVALAVGFTALAPTIDAADGAEWPELTPSDCEEAAARIKEILDGGKEGKITPDPPDENLGEIEGKPNDEGWAWAYHCVVIKRGIVYDALTGPDGEAIADYERRYRNAPNIEFPWDEEEC